MFPAIEISYLSNRVLNSSVKFTSTLSKWLFFLSFLKVLILVPLEYNVHFFLLIIEPFSKLEKSISNLNIPSAAENSIASKDDIKCFVSSTLLYFVLRIFANPVLGSILLVSQGET